MGKVMVRYGFDAEAWDHLRGGGLVLVVEAAPIEEGPDNDWDHGDSSLFGDDDRHLSEVASFVFDGLEPCIRTSYPAFVRLDRDQTRRMLELVDDGQV